MQSIHHKGESEILNSPNVHEVAKINLQGAGVNRQQITYVKGNLSATKIKHDFLREFLLPANV